MFTGIIEDIGVITNIRKLKKEKEFSIHSKLSSSLQIGQSVAVNGVCLSITAISKSEFNVVAVYETLENTNLSELRVHSKVHLERALQLSQRLDGHIVQGHIDGTGKIKKIEQLGDAKKIYVTLPEKLNQYTTPKGSIALSGVSLTIVDKMNSTISVVIVPITLKNTLIQYWKVGEVVNVEVDILSKYIENFLSNSNRGSNVKHN